MTAEPHRPWQPRDAAPGGSPPRPLSAVGATGAEYAPRRDMSRYPKLIADGVAAAEQRGGPVSHLTARRMSLLLNARSRDPQLRDGLSRFAGDGSLTDELCQSLTRYAGMPGDPHHAQSQTLLEYAAARGDARGPVGPDFGDRCDEADQADAMRAAGMARRMGEDPAVARVRGWPYTGYRAPHRIYIPGDEITPREWAEIDADDLWGAWEEYEWERDHEIE